MLLIDQGSQELAFVVAYPHQLSDLASVRVPVGEGIAGLVAMTGQPMADFRSADRSASRVLHRRADRATARQPGVRSAGVSPTKSSACWS